MEDVSRKTDQEIISLLKKRDDYFGEIIDRYEDKLGRYISRISSPTSEDKEDILQNVFTKVYKNINSYNPDMKFNSWIYRICHNETISYWRKTKKDKENISIDDEGVSGIENIFEDNDLDLNLDQLDAKIITEKVFIDIDIKHRDILVLRFVEGYSYEEMSDILKKPVNTVGTLVSRAKKEFLVKSKKYYESN